MSVTKAVSVVGYKKSGKTRVVEALVKELTNRGYKVGTLKHTVDDVPLDTPGKDTWRHREAGSIATAIMHGKGAAFFIDKYFNVNEAVSKLGILDFIVFEGFKSIETVSKIIVLKKPEDLESLSNGLEIAIADLQEEKLNIRSGIPVIPIDNIKELADIVEEKTFPMLSGLDCHGCGYDSCKSLGTAILSGEAEADNCVVYTPDFSLRVNDENIPIGSFVQSAIKNVVLGFIKTLKGVKEPSEVELKFRLTEKD